MEGIRQINPQKLQQLELEESLLLFMVESKKVIQSVNKWSNHGASSLLDDIVEKVYRLSNIDGLQQLLHLIPSGPTKMVKEAAFAPTLLNTIRKVSRYKEAARIIYRSYCPHHRGPSGITSPRGFRATPALGMLNKPLSCFFSPRENQWQTFSESIRGKVAENLGEQFSQQTTRILQEAKIHAEIQIIAYCDIASPPLYPRVIASSKDACFLCHEFIQCHNKIHTSRTHGRLYPGWRLPNLPCLKMVEHKFNEILLDLARYTLRNRAKGQIDIHPHPNESTLLPMLASASTMSVVSDQANIKEKTILPHVVSSGPKSLETAASTKYQLVEIEEAVGSIITSTDPFAGVIGPRTSSPFFLAGSMRTQLQMEEGLDPEYTTKAFAYSIARLNVSQCGELSTQALMVDIMKLEGEVTFELPPDGRFCLIAHDVRVNIMYQER
ncbi:hypothetical protein N7450_011530 [Penicillium hetheringtonii]|uniref:Uncharacterized protein n=1 Tax=Penicillium hetheringtonii TaxID=911720 RepID=A0AAD6GNQ8_9EURO|nr:hypothetical protein N7450_011530 [Penicillium hetheringtonii]